MLFRVNGNLTMERKQDGNKTTRMHKACQLGGLCEQIYVHEGYQTLTANALNLNGHTHTTNIEIFTKTSTALSKISEMCILHQIKSKE